ncbi:MAG: 50S ribosomal protein L6 [Treponema sp. GWB1_62_6]|nr:MAG: 50S ribosomal protein L6 [Treponema sp. GWA1_62_8]OHE69615.1 MAG: 50S ribosomal protein L6 [Treponema sp. GWC1_61_84]OHE71300.1 MAG: 50S ribosomal protein L6 [Treponema sp. GWB1_62_6]OHE71528.1 MAG: 50S ribosomal protein L6 [Treponema sp. RIFOXYC1_FULL_61_9]HCM25051.1 50S ribosomal protein L6 [Treponema sp.]
MSRIGKIPVKIPQGVKVSFENEVITVEGPKGKLTQQYHSVVTLAREGDEIIVGRKNEEKQTKAYHGLYRNLLNNMVVGVTAGFTRSLVINGVGFRAEVKGNLLTMNLGYSNDITVMVPKDLTTVADANGKITISGIDKQRVGEFASQVRKLRLPEPYKGKGIRYDDEVIRRKVGKSGVK